MFVCLFVCLFVLFSLYLILAYLMFLKKWMFRHNNPPVTKPKTGKHARVRYNNFVAFLKKKKLFVYWI